MIPSTPQFAAALLQPHEATTRIEVWRGGGLMLADLPISGGRLSIDAGGSVRYVLDAEVSDPTLIPTSDTSLLAPLDTQFRVFKGIRYPSGQVEELRIGTLWLEDVTGDRPDLTLTVTAGSRSLRVSQAGFASGPFQSVPTNRVDQEIPRVIQKALGGSSPPITATPATGWPLVPKGTKYDGDPWDAVRDLADLGGGECFYDRLGDLVLRETPAMKPVEDAIFQVGPTGTIVRSTSTISRIGGANGARVTFTSSDAKKPDVVSVVRHDAGGTSPTRWDGPMGRLLLVATRPGPVTQAEADKATTALLRRRLGLTRQVSPIEVVTDPRIEPGDTVRLKFASGANERHVVQSVTIDLGTAATMTITTRSAELVPT